MKAILLKKQVEAAEVITFFFQTELPLIWQAGQSIRLEVPISSYDSEEKRFTISSAPYEQVVAITTRMSGSPFKVALNNLSIGQAVELSALEKAFTWHGASEVHVFLAGGMGITPFHSMIKQRLFEDALPPVELFCIGSQDRLPFKAQFEQWQSAAKQLKMHYFPDHQPAIEDMLKHRSSYYIAGPTGMVRFWQQQLSNAGVALHTIKTDHFTGL